MAIVNAASAFAFDKMAKAVAIIDAIFISGGAAAQIFTNPKDINSKRGSNN